MTLKFGLGLTSYPSLRALVMYYNLQIECLHNQNGKYGV